MNSAAVLSQEETKVMNQTLFEKLGSGDRVYEKQAVDVINDFTRTRVREDGIWRRAMPLVPISNDQLDRATDTVKPIKIVDREPDSPAAVTLPFAALPMNLYIRGPRYRVNFVRLETTRFTTDVSDLRTWIMDIRQVLSDNAIKDLLAEEDSAFLEAVNSVLVAQDTIVPTSGSVQWEAIAGGITRDTLWESRKVMPNTPHSLSPSLALVNHITIMDVCKLDHPEMGGGDISADIMKNGWTLKNFMGIDWIISIKKSLVPTSSIYYFADPRFVGKSFELEPTTLYVRREAYLLEFFAYEEIGGAIGHTSGLARVDWT